MNDLVIIARIEEQENLSGPGAVAKSLMNGLDEKNIKYTLINSYNKSKLKTFFKCISFIFKKNKIINIHSFGYSIPYLFLFISKFNKKNKYYLTLHGLYSFEYLINTGNSVCNDIIKKEEKIIKEFPNIICVSKFYQKFLEEKYGRTSNIYFVNNGLTTINKIYNVKKENSYVYAGGFTKLKNPMKAVKLFEQIYKNDKTAILYICGSKTDKILFNNVNDYIHSKKLEKVITIYDYLTKAELFDLFNKSKYIIAPSKFDTYNMTVLEAMNYGCIPIVSSFCGIKDVIEGVGIVSDDIKEIIKEINKIDSNKTEKESFKLSLKNTYIEMTENYLNVLK